MKRGILILTLMSAALAGGVSALCAEGGSNPALTPASYYGDNDLREYFEASEMMRRFSESTVALFSPSNIPLDPATGEYKLKDLTLGGKYNLREGEAFGGQPVGAYCSGVLVGEDLVLTAGHCFKPHPRGGPCDKVKFVFGYAVNRAGSAPSSFPAANVYGCSAILAQQVREQSPSGGGIHFTCRNGQCTNRAVNGNGADYALVRLDRKVRGRVPLAISRTDVSAGDSVGAIGHPSGLPVKIQEEGAAVRTVTREGFFTANLDAFGGNSGSPVFDMRTFRVAGILIRGGVDYVYTSPSSTSTVVEDPSNPYLYNPGQANYYPQDGGRGEDVTLISEVQALIPRTEMEAALESAGRPRQGGEARPVPAVYTPGQGGYQVQPAVYTVPEVSGPEMISI